VDIERSTTLLVENLKIFRTEMQAIESPDKFLLAGNRNFPTDNQGHAANSPFLGASVSVCYLEFQDARY